VARTTRRARAVTPADTGTEETWLSALEPLLGDARLVYVGLFAAALIDATGLPFPGRVILVAAGAGMASDWLDVAALTAAAALGAVAGDHLWWAAGRMGAGPRLLAVYCRLSLASRRCERRTRERFDRFGPFAIVVGRFVAGVRVVSGPVAGGGALSYPRYLLFDVLAAVVWAAAFVALGYALGAQWRLLLERYGTVAIVAAVAVMVGGGIVGIVAVRLMRRRRHGAAGPDPAAAR